MCSKHFTLIFINTLEQDRDLDRHHSDREIRIQINSKSESFFRLTFIELHRIFNLFYLQTIFHADNIYF